MSESSDGASNLGVDQLSEIIGNRQVGCLSFGNVIKMVGVDEVSGTPILQSVVTESLSVDQRVVEPELAAQFLEAVNKFITRPEQLMAN